MAASASAAPALSQSINSHVPKLSPIISQSLVSSSKRKTEHLLKKSEHEAYWLIKLRQHVRDINPQWQASDIKPESILMVDETQRDQKVFLNDRMTSYAKGRIGVLHYPIHSLKLFHREFGPFRSTTREEEKATISQQTAETPVFIIGWVRSTNNPHSYYWGYLYAGELVSLWNQHCQVTQTLSRGVYAFYPLVIHESILRTVFPIPKWSELKTPYLEDILPIISSMRYPAPQISNVYHYVAYADLRADKAGLGSTTLRKKSALIESFTRRLRLFDIAENYFYKQQQQSTDQDDIPTSLRELLFLETESAVNEDELTFRALCALVYDNNPLFDKNSTFGPLYRRAVFYQLKQKVSFSELQLLKMRLQLVSLDSLSCIFERLTGFAESYKKIPINTVTDTENERDTSAAAITQMNLDIVTVPTPLKYRVLTPGNFKELCRKMKQRWRLTEVLTVRLPVYQKEKKTAAVAPTPITMTITLNATNSHYNNYWPNNSHSRPPLPPQLQYHSHPPQPPSHSHPSQPNYIISKARRIQVLTRQQVLDRWLRRMVRLAQKSGAMLIFEIELNELTQQLLSYELSHNEKGIGEFLIFKQKVFIDPIRNRIYGSRAIIESMILNWWKLFIYPRRSQQLCFCRSIDSPCENRDKCLSKSVKKWYETNARRKALLSLLKVIVPRMWSNADSPSYTALSLPGAAFVTADKTNVTGLFPESISVLSRIENIHNAGIEHIPIHFQPPCMQQHASLLSESALHVYQSSVCVPNSSGSIELLSTQCQEDIENQYEYIKSRAIGPFGIPRSSSSWSCNSIASCGLCPIRNERDDHTIDFDFTQRCRREMYSRVRRWLHLELFESDERPTAYRCPPSSMNSNNTMNDVDYVRNSQTGIMLPDRITQPADFTNSILFIQLQKDEDRTLFIGHK
jgi:hypothetical protein